MKMVNKSGGKIGVDLWAAIICLVVAIAFQSRSFILGYSASILFILFAKFGFEINRKRASITGVTLASLLVFLIFCFKGDSSSGRMLIYKISLQILRDYPWAGIGWGNFPKVYGDYQVAYFKSGSFTTEELLLADNTKHAFNDYLQFIIETGVTGAIVASLFTLFIVKSIMLSVKKNKPLPLLLLLGISQITAVSVAAMFMHVFERFSFQTIFLVSLITIVYYAHLSKDNIKVYISLVLLSLCSSAVMHYSTYLIKFSYYQIIKEAKTLSDAGYKLEALDKYRAAYVRFENDINYLSDYATLLSSLKHYEEAESVLEKLVQRDNASVFYKALGDCYFANGKIREAEAAYCRAVYMVPNRFTTRYSLFNLYTETQQHGRAIKTAKAILDLPVKVPSEKVEYIKACVQKYLYAKRYGAQL